MTDKGKSDDVLQENALVAQLIKQGAETAISLRGIVGASPKEGYIRLHPRITNLTESVEIARADILHAMSAPKSTLGAVILWVKKDANISVHKSDTPKSVTKKPSDLVEVQKGRLRMRVRAPQSEDLCFSVCMDCLSWCSCSLCSSTPMVEPAK